MSFKYHGKIKVKKYDPLAAGCCDRCGTAYQHSELQWQYEWRGDNLENIRWLVCPRCLDQPQPQLKTRRIPPDPLPIKDIRREDTSATYLGTLNFSQYSLITSANDPTSMLASLALASGVATPSVTSRNGTITQSETAQSLVSTNGSRTYLAIMNPNSVPICVSFGTASFKDNLASLVIGGMGAVLWATSQGNGSVSTAPMTIICNVAGLPYYCYEG